jgi:hypothetical protein
MMKNRPCIASLKKKGFLSLIVLLNLVNLFSQEIVSVQKEIEAKFNGYVKNNRWEEVYLNTDRVDYISGENIWFTAYLTDRKSNLPSDESRIVYVELLSSTLAPVIQRRISVRNGYGPGQIMLPDTLSSGIYTLRAYTGYMKNFLPVNCFTRKINIYNAISVKASDSVPAANVIYPGSYRFKSATAGYLQEGLSPRSVKLTGDSLEMQIWTSDSYRTGNNNKSILIIETRGNINYSSVLILSGGSTKLFVPRRLLMQGISHITFFDSKGKPVSESFILNIEKDGRKEDTDQKIIVSRREKVKIDFIISEAGGKPDSSSVLSVAAVPATGNIFNGSLPEYLLFGSEFGQLTDEQRYEIISDTAGPENKSLDSFRSNWINWDKILSPVQAENSFTREKEDHLISGRLISKGTGAPAAGEYLFLSMPGKKAVFQYSITGNNGHFDFAVPVTEAEQDIIIQPEKAGNNYSVEIFSNFAPQPAVVNDSLKKTDSAVPFYINRLGINYQVNRIYGITDSKFDKKEVARLQEARRFYGKPDIGLIMDDYIKLPVMDEVFYELLPGVSMKTRKSKTEISLIGSNEYLTYSKPPALFIDGVVISDAGIIAGLDPEVVEEIDVIKERYIVGDYIFYGLVNVITRSGDFSNATLPDYATRLRYRVFDPLLSFSSPDYSVAQNTPDKLPDFRNTLYWNPSLKSAPDGKVSVEFWSSDLPGDYEVTIQGFSGDGKAVSMKRIITIR